MIHNSNCTQETTEQTTLTNKFIAAWVSFCISTVTQQAKEESFQAWLAAYLIQLFGLERVYREIHFGKDEIKGCFSLPGLKALFPDAHDKRVIEQVMDGSELFPDVCVSRTPSLDTRSTSTRSEGTRHFTQIIKEISIVTELKVGASTKKSTGIRYSSVYKDIVKLGVIMNATKGESGMPLFFSCILANLPNAQSKDFVERTYVRPLLKAANGWPSDWRKPMILVTAPVRLDSDAEWQCHLIDGASDWRKQRIVARFPASFAVVPDGEPSLSMPQPRAPNADSAQVSDLTSPTAGQVSGEARMTTRADKRQAAFFLELSRSVGKNNLDFAKSMMDDMVAQGCAIEWGKSSYSVRLPDPSGTKQRLTIFVVEKTGKVYVGWLPDQLKKLKLPTEIATDFVRSSAHLFNVEVSNTHPELWSRKVWLADLQNNYGEFVGLVQRTINAINTASGSRGTEG